MATIRKRLGRKGKVSWQIDFYDPGGRRVMKCFRLKSEAEAYLGKAVSAKREGSYSEIFEAEKPQVSFTELADRYEENYRTQKSYRTFKRHVVNVLRARFGANG